MYAALAAQHAQQLVAAGVDFIVVDMTNLPEYDQTADAIQLRPFEVLCEVRVLTTPSTIQLRPFEVLCEVRALAGLCRRRRGQLRAELPCDGAARHVLAEGAGACANTLPITHAQCCACAWT